nr:MAG TPA: hypothetical protein [Bacteriophage sp.]
MLQVLVTTVFACNCNVSGLCCNDVTEISYIPTL